MRFTNDTDRCHDGTVVSSPPPTPWCSRSERVGESPGVHALVAAMGATLPARPGSGVALTTPPSTTALQATEP